ncbi:hypothetical protein Taro_034968, partial [Colocasia esculenta]|nr:hypothetical protein [Colocasia esculenta]
PLIERPTQSGNPNSNPSVRTRHVNPPGRVGENGTPIGSLFGILDPWVVGFSSLYVIYCFLDLSIERPTKSGNPNWNPSVRTRHVNPPGRVEENGTPIRSLFGILDPRVVCFNPLYVICYFLDPSIERLTQSGNPKWNPSVRTCHVNPPGRVGENNTPIGSLFGILDPRVVGFSSLYVICCFLDPSIERSTPSENPNWNPSVRTRHVNPPSRVGENGTPIRSLFGILDPRVVCLNPLYIRQLNARPNPGIQIGIRQFAHVTLTHPVISVN